MRRVTPPCAVDAIRKKYPEPDGIDIGFKNGEEIYKYDSSWIFQLEESELKIIFNGVSNG